MAKSTIIRGQMASPFARGRTDTSGASQSAAPPQKRVLILGYLTYRKDARVKNQVRVLRDEGYAVDVICLTDDGAEITDSATLSGIEVPRYRGSEPLRYIRSYTGFFLRAAIKATTLALRNHYEIVIVCNMPDILVFCVLIPKLLGARIILDVHDPMPELYRVKFGRSSGSLGERILLLEERASGWVADRVLATHRIHARRLEHAGIPARKLRIVVNAPSSDLFCYSTAPLNRSRNFRLVYHGTMAARLGVEVVIRAVGLLGDAIPEIELLMIGDGDDLDSCKELARDLGLAARIHFEPLAALERIPAMLQGCSIGVVPNRESAATQIMLPVKLIEYAMLGIPIVAARLIPIAEYFEADSVEFFEPDNAKDLARAIERLHRDPDRCSSIAGKAYRIAREFCANWDSNYLRAVGPEQ
jgi:glycosyltransferase involved in cell wall biosynthesis